MDTTHLTHHIKIHNLQGQRIMPEIANWQWTGSTSAATSSER